MHRALLLGLALALPAAHHAPLVWTATAPGVERVTFPMASRGLLASVQVIAFRLDPCRVQLDLTERTRLEGLRGAWTVDSITPDAILAMNAGQFREGSPWGWVVRNGVERQAPGTGSLAMAMVLDSGAVRLLRPEEIASARGRVQDAIQSYPALLIDGEIPAPLRTPGRGVDLEHRDSRLAVGTDAQGRVIIVLTRFTGLASAGATLPLGPTLPELAQLMARLGATRALGLDGGLSSQLAYRLADGSLERHANWRMVPMGIEARQKSFCPTAASR